MSVRRWVLAALLITGACGRSTTVHAGRERPISMDLAITERPVSLDLVPADATRVVPTQRASRDYRRRTQQVANLLPSGDAKAFIYNHESGNNPARHNAAGCRGLGQACPGSKLPCSDTDYGCQDNWFTRYMQVHYGSWEAAEAHWISRAYRCGADWCGGSW